MARPIGGIGGIGGMVASTPEEMIQRYVDWLKAHPRGTGDTSSASVGFMLARSIPLAFGADVAVESRGSQPEIIYAHGNLFFTPGDGLSGPGMARSSVDGFGKMTPVYVALQRPDILTVTDAPPMTMTLHHDVLVGSTRVAIESTSPGAVVTLMLWALPAQYTG